MQILIPKHSRSGTKWFTILAFIYKVIALDSQEQARKQIVVELKTLIQCRSPYIVEIISAFYVDASVYIVLEYMDGTLSDIVKGATRIPEHVLARVAIQV